MKQTNQSQSKTPQEGKTSDSKAHYGSEILDRIDTRKKLLEEEAKIMTAGIRKELETLETELRNYVKGVKGLTGQNMRSLTLWRIYAPITALLVVLTLGIALGAVAMYYLENKAIVTTHPDHRNLIQCQEFYEIKNQKFCQL